MLKVSLLLLLGSVVTLAQTHEPFHVKFQWNSVNYTWPSEEAYNKAKGVSYIERNNVISGIKFYKDRMYLTIPRWKTGVPVTLASTSATPVNGDTAPALEPYPSWEMQKLGDCRAFQFVQNVEIDPVGRMWVLDTGREMDTGIQSNCTPRLVILDLENDGKVIRNYPMPADVADPQTAYLYDIVLDHEDGGVAYISDADANKPGIIVFSLQNGTFWKMPHISTVATREAIGFKIDLIRVTPAFNIHGLALSPASSAGNRTLYYSPLSSFYIYKVSTSVLKNQALIANLSANDKEHFKTLGRKPSQTDGMTMSNTGVMYFGLLADDAVSLWDSSIPSFVTGQRIISRDHHLMQWPTSFAFDNKGAIWCITNRLQIFLNNVINIHEPNFRAIASNVSYTNYQYLMDGSIPEQPYITAGVGLIFNHASLLLANILAIGLLYLSV